MHKFYLIIILSVSLSSLGYSQSFEWARAFGAEGAFPISSTVNAVGNVYATGQFYGTIDFDPGAGVSELTSNSSNDIFISGLDVNGNFIWARQLVGGTSNKSTSIEVDNIGNIYVIGTFNSTVDFDPGPATYSLTASASPSTFVCKLDGNGNFIWVKEIGGNGNSFAKAVTVDDNQNVYVTGYFSNSIDFDPGLGTYNMTGGISNMFVMSLDISGDFRWARKLPTGGSNQNPLTATPDITTDAAGNVFTTGLFEGSSVTFNPSPEAADITLTSAGNADVFIVKHDTYGNCIWAKGMGGSYDDKSNSIALGADGSIYTTGTFINTADFDPGSGVYNLLGTGGATFISKLDSDGDFVAAYKFWGESGTITGSSIKVDDQNNIYAGGFFGGTVDFDPGPAPLSMSAGGYDGFLLKLNSSGSLEWVISIGGAVGFDKVYEVVLGSSGSVYLTGYFQETVDFDPTSGVYNLTSSANDVFVLKLGDGSPVGINETILNGAAIYPNPSSGIFTLQATDITEYRIYDVLGHLIENKKVNPNAIDLSSQPKGIYTLQLLTENGWVTQKLVIEQ